MEKSLIILNKKNIKIADKLRYNGIDIIKGIACFSVTYIHNSFPGKIGLYIQVLNRFAVPFFFFVSGYFFLNTNLEITNNRIINKIKHILLLIRKSVIFYFLFFICNLLNSKDINIKKISKKLLTKKNIISFIMFNRPFKYLHLWFLLALLYCYLFMLLMNSINRNIIINNIFEVFFIFFGFLGYHLLKEFGNIKFIKKFKSDIKLDISTFFMFRAFPFFLIGVFLKKTKIKQNTSILLLFIRGSFLACLEMYLFKQSLNSYIGTYFQLISLISFSLKEIKNTNKAFTFLSYVGRNLSDKIYIYHNAIGKTIKLISNKIGFINQLWFSYGRFILVLSSTLVFSFLLHKLKGIKIL